MRAIQQLAKRRRSNIVSPEQSSAASYIIPSPFSSGLHSSFAQLSLAAPRTEAPQSAQCAAVPRLPLSARRLFSDPGVAADREAGSGSSRRASLKRGLESDEDDLSERSLSHGSAHSDDHREPAHADAVQPLPAPAPSIAPKLRERPRRWTTPAASVPSSLPGAPSSRPSTPYVASAASPLSARPAPRPLVVSPAMAFSEDASSLFLPGSLSSSPSASSSPSSSAFSPPAKRASLSLRGGFGAHLMVPPSRPPTPLALSKRSTMPAAFKLGTLTSLAETVTMREEAEDDNDDFGFAGDGRRGGAGAGGFTFWPSATSVGAAAALDPKAGDGRAGRRRSLVASAGARSIWGGQF